MLKIIDRQLIDNVIYHAHASERKRAHHEIHESHEDLIQKVLIGLTSDTYIPPHSHNKAHQSELFFILRGKIQLVIFNDKGTVIDSYLFGEEGKNCCVEIPPNIIHTVVCMSEDAAMLEIKEGPYIECNSKIFPDWSIPENGVGIIDFINKIKNIKK